MNSRMIDSSMGIIHMYAGDENIPDIGGEYNPSPIFLNRGGKRIRIIVVDWLMKSETKCNGNIQGMTIEMLVR